MFHNTKFDFASALQTLGLIAPKPIANKQPGAGYMRAQERLRAKLRANKDIPSGDRMTRQRERAAMRADMKRTRVSDAERGRRAMKEARV